MHHNKKNNGLAAATATVTFGIGLGNNAAHAQQQKVQKPFAVKAGAFFPVDGTVKSGSSCTWFSGGLSVDLAQTGGTHPIVPQLYLDYTSRSKDYLGTKEKSRLYGVGPAVKFLLAPAAAKAQPYIGLGVGYYNGRVAVPMVYPSILPSLNNFPIRESYTRFGGKMFAGYQMRSGIFGEADYSYVGELDGAKPGGFNLRLGCRF